MRCEVHVNANPEYITSPWENVDPDGRGLAYTLTACKLNNDSTLASTNNDSMFSQATIKRVVV
jgi:hypothetical protein